MTVRLVFTTIQTSVKFSSSTELQRAALGWSCAGRQHAKESIFEY